MSKEIYLFVKFLKCNNVLFKFRDNFKKHGFNCGFVPILINMNPFDYIKLGCANEIDNQMTNEWYLLNIQWNDFLNFITNSQNTVKLFNR